MLIALNVRDLVIVEELALEFKPGFTVLTGETGAGKSILVSALALVLGARGDTNWIRESAAKAEITAEFDISNLRPLQEWLTESELNGDGGTCLMRRVLDTKGRSRAFINGIAVTLAQLRDAGSYLVDIHGQHEHQSLMRAAAQRALLDAYAQQTDLAARVAEAWQRWQGIRRELATMRSSAAALAAERDQLKWQVSEVGSLNFDLEGWHQLIAEHNRLAHAQTLIEGCQFALDALSEDESGSLASLSSVSSRLKHLLDYDPRLADVIEIIGSAQALSQEAIHMLRAHQQRLELDPQRLTHAEQRLDAVHAIARKYRVAPEELPLLLARARSRCDELKTAADAEAMQRAEAQARDTYLAEATKLSSERKRAARALSAKVSAAMQTLAMGGGSFEVALEPLVEGASSGLEHIEFLVAANRGATPQPLAKVASGGELSRISLAIQTATNEVAAVATLIFDEVDAGIGGRVAAIVGELLQNLGKKHQVMCVTHLPQVAAAADQQWRVTKAASRDTVVSEVTVLEREQRIDEIARMLGGAKITATTRKHAAEMLESARLKS